MGLEVGWWSVNPSDMPGSASHSAGNIATHTAMPCFSVGAEDLNSGPHLPAVSAGLVTEPPTTTKQQALCRNVCGAQRAKEKKNMQEREWEGGRKGMENKRRRQGGRVGREEKGGTEERGGTHDLLTNVRIRLGTQRKRTTNRKSTLLAV